MALSETVRVKVRFSEVDSLKVVWHGSYVQYLEDAREAFCSKWGIAYMTIYENGYLAPVYDMHLRYALSATVGDVLLVTASYKPAVGAKLCLDYEIRRESDNALVLTASTVQLFTDLRGQFEPSEPDFYRQWKEKMAQYL